MPLKSLVNLFTALTALGFVVLAIAISAPGELHGGADGASLAVAQTQS
ncbi:MAG TPA: hypothetical protein VIC25_05800 [Caulobacteraceae bacterium]